MTTWLTADDYRDRVTTAASDDAIEAALAAAKEAILDAIGASGTVTERLDGSLSPHVHLGMRPQSIVSVTELVGATRTVLSADDYEVRGTVLARLIDGTNPASWWRGQVVVVYEPWIGDATIAEVQAGLAEIGLSGADIATPGERLGDWSAGGSGALSARQMREELLGRLLPKRAVYFRGSGMSGIPTSAGS